MNQKKINKNNFLIQPYSSINIIQNTLIGLVLFVLFLIMFCKPIFETTYSKNVYDFYLINSLMNGKVYIDIEPSEELKNMENPYSYTDRQNEAIDYLFDTAYYNGHYYVYFGVVPAIIIFIPYKLLTGTYLGIAEGTPVFVVASMIINVMLSVKIYKKWFKQLPFAILFICILGNLISGLYIWNTWRIFSYELTLLSGFFFVQLGIYLIIKAIEEHGIDKEKKCGLYTFFASFSMAVAVGCRPTLVFSSIIMIPFFQKLIKRKKGKKISKTTSYNNGSIFYSCHSINVV